MELNKAVLDCMQQLRRRLREEQNLNIRLTQADAIQAMLVACLGSSDETTRDLGKRLASYNDMPLAVPGPTASPGNPHVPAVRIYRGQRVTG